MNHPIYPPRHPLTFRVPEADLARLRREAARSQVSVNALLTRMVTTRLDELEQQFPVSDNVVPEHAHAG